MRFGQNTKNSIFLDFGQNTKSCKKFGQNTNFKKKFGQNTAYSIVRVGRSSLEIFDKKKTSWFVTD